MDPRLVVALDTADRRQALAWVRELLPAAGTFKVGLELFLACGPSIVSDIAAAGADVFLDLKLHDIPNTVARSVAAVTALPRVRLLTLHAAGGAAMLTAAVRASKAASESGSRVDAAPLRLLGVTVLTSLGEDDLSATGITSSPSVQVVRLARIARDCGVDGIVCSPQEVATLRAELGPAALLVTPGVRPEGAERGDQKRTADPAQAIRDGASLLVVGRPITGAPSPLDAARRILASMP